MVKAAPRKSAAPAKTAVRRASSEAAPSSKPFLRFYHPEALRKKTLAVLRTVEEADDPTAHRDALGDIVVELTNSGLDAYFMKPLEKAKAGFIVKQSANLGLSGAQKVMGSVVRNIIGRMDRPQVLSVCGSIRQFMV